MWARWENGEPNFRFICFPCRSQFLTDRWRNLETEQHTKSFSLLVWRISVYFASDFTGWFPSPMRWEVVVTLVLFRFRDTSTSLNASSKRYVITNPPGNFKLLPTDQVWPVSNSLSALQVSTNPGSVFQVFVLMQFGRKKDWPHGKEIPDYKDEP